MKARQCTYLFPHLRQQLLRHPFSLEGSDMSSKKRLILMRIWHQLLLHFFFPKKRFPKKRLILMSAVMFSMNGFWMQYFTKKAEPLIVSKIILHHQRWCPNFNIFHCRQKLLVILQYSESFKWTRSNQNTGNMYKII